MGMKIAQPGTSDSMPRREWVAGAAGTRTVSWRTNQTELFWVDPWQTGAADPLVTGKQSLTATLQQ
jgi:hypothetical protein